MTARERRIAEEIAIELQRMLGPILPQDLGENGDTVRGVFGDAFDRHGIINETVAARILARVPKVLARLNLQFAELNRQLDAAIRTGHPKCQSERISIFPELSSAESTA
jgi:hypothetical protein